MYNYIPYIYVIFPLPVTSTAIVLQALFQASSVVAAWTTSSLVSDYRYF